MDKLIAKIKGHSTEMLKEVVENLMDNMEQGSDLVFDLAIDELEERLPENEFCQFCEHIYNHA